jgi:hypothetical protein
MFPRPWIVAGSTSSRSLGEDSDDGSLGVISCATGARKLMDILLTAI